MTFRGADGFEKLPYLGMKFAALFFKFGKYSAQIVESGFVGGHGFGDQVGSVSVEASTGLHFGEAQECERGVHFGLHQRDADTLRPDPGIFTPRPVFSDLVLRQYLQENTCL